MPCDIASSLKDTCQTVFGLKFLNTIFSSTLWSGFLITVIVLLILMVTIPVEADMPVYLLFKFMFYVFLSSVAVLFLHTNSTLINKEEAKEKTLDEDLAKKLENPNDNPLEKGVKVEPKIITQGGLDPVFSAYGV